MKKFPLPRSSSFNFTRRKLDDSDHSRDGMGAGAVGFGRSASNGFANAASESNTSSGGSGSSGAVRSGNIRSFFGLRRKDNAVVVASNDGDAPIVTADTCTRDTTSIQLEQPLHIDTSFQQENNIRTYGNSTNDKLTPSFNPRISPSDYLYHTSPNGGSNAPLTPLSLHYDSNSRLLELLSSLISNGGTNGLQRGKQFNEQYSLAYAVGIKFIEVALFQIPKHGYYESEGYELDKRKSLVEANRVVELLGGLLDELDDVDGTIGGEGGGGGGSVASSIGRSERGSISVKERKETVQKLAVVAKRSFQEAVESRSKRNYLDCSGAASASAASLSTFWKEYVVDGTDNLCSFWSLDCGGLVGVVDDHNTNVGVDHADDEMEEKKQDQVVAGGLQSQKQQQRVRSEFSEHVVPTAAFSESRWPKRSVLKSFSSQSSSEVPDVASFVGVPENAIIKNNIQSAPRRGESLVFTEQYQSATPIKEVTTSTSEIAPSLIQQHSVIEDVPLFTQDGFDQEELQLALSLSMTENNITQSASSNEYRFGDDESIQLQYGKLYFVTSEQNRISSASYVAGVVCDYDAWDGGLPDEHIANVIDVYAQTILSEVRNNLNLAADSFIVPSDVHDHLMDIGLLSPTSFVGVCGGNVLDDEHLGQLKNTLLLLNDERERKRLKGRKLAAVFFFHGHVVALHVIDKGPDDVWIELIDSLPNPDTWARRSTTTSFASSDCEEREPAQAVSRRSDHSDDDEWERHVEYDDRLPLNAVRVRCVDDCFDTLIRHYAVSKFSREEHFFIDQTQWEDNNSHFDPRVFQAFIWAEAD
eukprot:g8045.t1 g8045   contig27:63470-66081(-)